MKSFYFILTLVFAFAAEASERSFTCTSQEQTVDIVLTTTHVQMGDVTFTNMLDVDPEMDYRGYSYIHNPWMSLLVSTAMLDGEPGPAELLVVDLNTDQSQTTYFSCAPKP